MTFPFNPAKVIREVRRLNFVLTGYAIALLVALLLSWLLPYFR
jgi:hypothetical protein